MYTSNGCASCRKAKKWLKDHNIEFIEKNIFTTLLNENEIRYLLKRTDNGTDDIISPRSKIIKENNIDIESMTINELVKFVVQNPSVLKRPIILSDRIMQVGYDAEEIDAFIPPELRNYNGCAKEKCPHYSTCGNCREEV